MIALSLACWLPNLFLQKYIPDTKEIKDLGHYYIPESNLSYLVSDILLTVIAIATYLSIRNDKPYMNMLQTNLNILFIIRFVSVLLTVLPRLRKENQGNDFIFSGHTMVVLSCLLTLSMKYPERRCMFAAIFLLKMYVILSSRMHYTVDVYLAAILTLFVFRKPFDFVYKSLTCGMELP